MNTSPKVMYVCQNPVIGFSLEPAADGTIPWSVTTLLGKFLSEAEARFGPRDKEWTILGVAYDNGDIPHVRYFNEDRQVFILLGDNARLDWTRVIFQLAHEVVHLLSPIGNADATVIEEGVATYFQHEMAQAWGSNYVADLDSYQRAEALVRNLLDLQPDAILRARQIESSFTKITPTLLKSICPVLTNSDAQALCLPFARF